MKYCVGQYVMYKNSKICRVESIGKVDFAEPGQEYYTLRPPFTTSNERIYVPVDSDTNMRTAMTAGEAQTHLSRLQQMPVEPCRSAKHQQLTEHYQQLMVSDDINAHLQLFKELSQKEAAEQKRGGRLGEAERRYKDRVEQFLSEEMAVALNESPEASADRLRNALISA